MDPAVIDQFFKIWTTYFPEAELPIICYYTDDEKSLAAAQKPAAKHCLIEQLQAVRAGQVIAFSEKTIHCGGGKRYLGFAPGLRPNFEFFLSCGIPGKMEGERYKKSPDIVRELLARDPGFSAPAHNILFKRWDLLTAQDAPEVVIFFATADVLSGLFTLSGYEEAADDSVIAPFSAGCGSIIKFPYLERQSGRHRSVLGLFDVSARPHVSADRLTMAVPWPRFAQMIANADESFLTTTSWQHVRSRIKRGARTTS